LQIYFINHCLVSVRPTTTTIPRQMTTSPSVSTPNHHDQKYDRQLRLWGSHGQKRLEETNICLIGGTAVGTETLKNLILPGLGKFAVVDKQIVSNADLGRSFFVEHNDVGKKRAEVTTRLLRELNPDCKEGIAIDKSVEELISVPSFFDSFNIVVATGVEEGPLLKLASICWEKNILFAIVDIYGLLGYIRLQVKEHTVVESHPEFSLPDLRISAPFEGLVKYSNSLNPDEMNSAQHSHIPFPILLLKALDIWKKEHGGKPPSSSKEKDEFKRFVTTLSWSPKEVNFQEAYQNAHLASIPVKVPDEVQNILDDNKAKNLTKESTHFWILASALSEFVKNNGNALPLSGAIPDMTALTQYYIDLQNVYNTQAAAHVEAVTKHVHAILIKLGKPTDEISEEEIKRFCKNAGFLCCIRHSQLEKEYNATADTFPKDALEGDWQGNGPWYLVYRAAQRYRQIHNKFPGPNDFAQYKQTLSDLLKQLGVSEDFVSNDHVKEILRAENAKLHTLAAIMGGIASQEIIKLITLQWVPLDNSYIYNGLHSTSSSYKL